MTIKWDDVQAAIETHLPTADDVVARLERSLGNLNVPSDGALAGVILAAILKGVERTTGEVVRPEYLGGDWKVYAAYEHSLLQALEGPRADYLAEIRSRLSALVAERAAAEAAAAKRISDTYAYAGELIRTHPHLFKLRT